MRRERNAKIVGTLGPASNNQSVIEQLFDSGVDAFRLNFSHGTHSGHEATCKIVRELESKRRRPIGIIADLQGPKHRIGKMHRLVALQTGQRYKLDLDQTPGDEKRAPLLHPEIFNALTVGKRLLIDDGKVELRVLEFNASEALTEVTVGGDVSSNKGVNIPDLVLPISALTVKDLKDLEFALSLGVDWIAISFVQKPEDILELRELIQDQAAIMAKLEKPSAIENLEEIVELSDGIMLARGDLGVEIPQQKVPVVQRKVIRQCRSSGKPVIVATQMLESMISSPVPTRAETSDVATAIYDGADAVMLSAESAAGKFPVEAVAAMNQIVCEVENDVHFRQGIEETSPDPIDTPADAISSSLSHIANVIPLAATFTYTQSGFTSFRAARVRPIAPIIGCTPSIETARRLALVWGVHAVVDNVAGNTDEMVFKATSLARREGFAVDGELIAITAGVPFGRSGTTNMLRLARLKPLAATV